MLELFEKLKNNDDTPAIVCCGNTFSYADLCAEIEKTYAILKKEIPQGASVALLSDYGKESLAAFFALALNKCVLVPIVSKIKNEIADKLKISNCEFSVSFNANGNVQVEKTEHIQNEKSAPFFEKLREKNSAGLVLFSSGSTGTAKAMLHDLDILASTFSNAHKRQARTFLLFLLFDHIGGLNTLFHALAIGAKIVIPTTRAPEEIARIIESEKVNVLPTTPTFLNLFLLENLREKYDLSSLRLISYGTEPMPETLLKRLKETFPRTKFLQTFGTSETGISQTRSRSSDSTLLKLDDPQTEYKIVDGELWLRTKTQILGYLNASSTERFTPDGWFKTGDLVEEHETGFLKIVGRNSDIINVGGEKVFPTEVENVLLEIPQVSDCLVSGESNPITGQMVVANIVLREPMKTLELKRLITAFCQTRLARYKIPTRLTIIPAPVFSERFKKKRHNEKN